VISPVKACHRPIASIIAPRIESGSSAIDTILKHLKRGKSRLEYHERAIEICHRHGIAVLGNMICGYIDETPEEFDESTNWFRRQPIDYVAPHLYTPYPGTPAWDKCVALGIIDPYDIDEEAFHTHKGSRNVIVNTVFPPGELERRYRAIGEEFRRRNTIMVLDRALSWEERVTLYAEASELRGRRDMGGRMNLGKRNGVQLLDEVKKTNPGV